MEQTKNNINIEKTLDYQKNVLLSILGIITYCITYLIGTLFEEASILLRLLQVFGLFLIAISLIKAGSFKNLTNVYFKSLLVIIMFWHMSLIIRNCSFEFSYIKTYFREPYYFLHFFVPLIVLLPANYFAYYFSKSCIIMCNAFLIMLIPCSYLIFGDQTFSEQYVWVFGTCGGFLLLISHYIKIKRIQVCSLIVVVLSFLIATYMARRNIMLTFTGYMFAYFCLIFVFSKSFSIVKKIISVLFLTLLGTGLIFFFLSNADSTFSRISERALENSRDEVFLYYFADMSLKDLAVGKGMNGSYYAPGVDKENSFGSDSDYRPLIECGYLQMILKGGIINVIILLLTAIPAFIKGIFFSNNLFCKSAGFLVALWLIDMFPWGMPAMDIRYMLFWFCIGVCYNLELRSFSDDEVREYCFPL